jgi:hypothetical protein
MKELEENVARMWQMRKVTLSVVKSNFALGLKQGQNAREHSNHLQIKVQTRM